MSAKNVRNDTRMVCKSIFMTMLLSLSLLLSLTVLAILILPGAPVFAASVETKPAKVAGSVESLKSSTQIIEEAKDLDGKTIAYQGEIIGDIMRRGDHVWINVSDGSNAIGIWITTAQAEGLSIAGRYNAHGDVVKVTGVFNRTCPEHGGDYDIHPLMVDKIESGYPIGHPVKLWLVLVSLVLTMGAALVLILYWFQRRRVTGKWSVRMMTPVGIRLRLR